MIKGANLLAWVKTPFVLPGFIFLWSLGWILSRHFPFLPASYDSAYYMVAAKGFALGRPYHDFSSPDPNVGALLGPSFYPFLLSLFWRFMHPHLFPLQLIMASLMALGPVMVFVWLRLWFSKGLALFIALAFGSSYMFIVLGNSFTTEIVFTPMLYAAMWLMHRSLINHGLGNKSYTLEKGSAMALVVLLARTRVVGWIIFGIFLFLTRRIKNWRLMFTGIAVAGAWVTFEKYLALGVPVSKYTDTVFTKTYPILVDFEKGLSLWWANVWHNIHAFTLSIDAHILFPFFYDLVDMNKGKRLACLGIFLWSAGGAFLTWRRWPGMRIWLLGIGIVSLPTFLIFTSNDSFRYHVPYFPFFVLFLLAPCIYLAENSSSVIMKKFPIAMAILVLVSQSLHALTHDFDTEFIDGPRAFKAIHDSLLSQPKRPDICLSPNNYYTYLLTDIPSYNLQGRNTLEDVAFHSRGKEVWAICGPPNDYFCQGWEKQGLVFSKTPISEISFWRLYRIQVWPDFPNRSQ